ncbi:hypothetical protein BYT27DRAFT_7123395, partial [Phlegmacium glaucopus]
IVNALSSKIEIGSPMAAMYLLQNPDHYVSHNFIPFLWKSFVNDVRNCDSNDKSLESVETSQHIFEIYVVEHYVDDYKYCPEAYKNMSLYDWSRFSVKAKHKRNDPTYL